MQQNDTHGKNSSTALCYQGVVPVEWDLLSGSVGAALRQRYQHDNIILLQGLLVVDEQPKPVLEHDEELSSLGQELQRIDHKLNLLLELLSQTLRSWRSLPPPTPVRLTVDGVEWDSDEPLPVGEPVQLRIYLSPVFPNPFVVSGQVRSCRPKEEGGSHVSVRFDELGGQVREVLEKMVFRQHRREVARRRSAKPVQPQDK